MQFTAKDFGYTVYSRVEEAFRAWIVSRLLILFGDQWHSQVPEGVWQEVQEHFPIARRDELTDPSELIDNTYLGHIAQIVCYQGAYKKFFPNAQIDQTSFLEQTTQLNTLRAKVAHVRRSFSQYDLEQLLLLATGFSAILGREGEPINDIVQAFRSDPSPYIVRLPPEFIIDKNSESGFQHLTNLPPADYDMDGGFVGRKEDLKTVRKYLTGNLYRIVTIAGAGGVGKTALAHQLCESILSLAVCPFDGVIWLSAKEEELTISGIEPLIPELKTVEDLLDTLLEVLIGPEVTYAPSEKYSAAEAALNMCEKGILLVIDNLETIADESIIEYVKELPPPHRVLITSRLGLGEIEKRHPLKAMPEGDAITLFRCLAREKQLFSVAASSDDLIRPYIRKMCCFPLALKWALGQVALGRDINEVTDELTAPESQITKFTFDTIYSKHLDNGDRLVLCALSTDERPMTKGVLCHIANLAPEAVDQILQRLITASLVINTISKTPRGDLETRYELLALTRGYVYSKLKSDPETYSAMKGRISVVQHMLTEANQARVLYKSAANEITAVTEEEKIALMWARAATERYEGGQYEAAVKMFTRAADFAPRYAAVYRTWAMVESTEGHYDRALELMNKALELGATNEFIWLSAGQMETKWGHYELALEHLNRGLSIAPEDTRIMNAIADIERRRYNCEAAEALFEKTSALMESRGIAGRQMLILTTNRADNLRRWAERLVGEGYKDTEAVQRLLQAMNLVRTGIQQYPSDKTLQSLRKEISMALGYSTLRLSGFESARQYFDDSINWNPTQEREKRITESACLILADWLLRAGQREAGRKYIDMCKKLVAPKSKGEGLLNELLLEYSHQRVRGILEHVVLNQGFGFIKAPDSQQVLLHRNAIVTPCSVHQFDRLQGRSFSYLVTPGAKGPRARRAVILPELDSPNGNAS